MANDDLVQALMEDSVDYLNRFVPIPKESLKWILNRMKKNPTNKYLDIDRDKIQSFYEKDKLNHLRLNFNGEMDHLPQHIVIDNTEKNLAMDHFVLKFTDDVFELPKNIADQTSEAFTGLTKSIKYTNEENLRLSNLTYQDDVYTFYTQPVYYRTYLHSNMVMDHHLKGSKSLRESIHQNGELEAIDKSLLGNHLGINILLFTPGGHLILPLRSKQVSYAPSELSASISGAVSAHDLSDGDSFDQIELIREGIEELGLQRPDILKESIKFLGLTRELVRGGKPEVFFSMETTLTKNEISERWQTAKDKWENKTLNFYQFDESVLRPLDLNRELKPFNKQIDSLFDDLGANMSLPLITNLALWIKLKKSGN